MAKPTASSLERILLAINTANALIRSMVYVSCPFIACPVVPPCLPVNHVSLVTTFTTYLQPFSTWISAGILPELSLLMVFVNVAFID